MQCGQVAQGHRRVCSDGRGQAVADVATQLEHIGEEEVGLQVGPVASVRGVEVRAQGLWKKWYIKIRKRQYCVDKIN